MTATSKTIATKSEEDFEERKENSNKDEETQLILEQTIFPFHDFYQHLPNLIYQIWAASIPFIDDFNRVSWLIFILFKLTIFVKWFYQKIKCRIERL